ncbi:MAG TPA: GNAT family N-acetyltransferase [Clostridiales bacterium]|nr:GNAT family N-acetyltransferase [Clostridiales bacterium]
MTNNLNELKSLHKMAFGDSDKYIDFFFNNRYESKYCYPEKSNEKIVSVTYARIIDLFLNGNKIQIPFLHSIATHNDFRHKGYAKKTITKALDNLKLEGFPFVLLHPFKHSFYENLGFTTISYALKKQINPTPPIIKVNDTGNQKIDSDNIKIESISLKHLDDIDKIYKTKAKQYLAYNNRNLKEWKNILNEHLEDNGFGYLIYKNMIPICYILIYSNNEIRELVTLDDNLLNHIDFLDNTSFFEFSKKEAKYTMGKILSVSKSLYFLPFYDDISSCFNVDYEGELFSIKVEKGKVTAVSKIVNLDNKKLLQFSKSSLLETIFGLSFLSNTEASIFKDFGLFLFDTY